MMIQRYASSSYKYFNISSLDIACSPSYFPEEQSDCLADVSVSDDLLLITSLHDSVPSLNTNMNQNYGSQDSNLKPINEEDEISFPGYHEDLAPAEFKRGGMARSTMRLNRSKNFKNLTLDMTVCKDNLKTDNCYVEKVSPGESTDSLTPLTPFCDEDFESLSPTHDDVVNIEFKESKYTYDDKTTLEKENSPVESPITVPDENFQKNTESVPVQNPESKNEPRNLPPLQTSRNLSKADKKKSPNLPRVSLPDSLDISLSDGEDLFDDLSNDMSEDLTEDEEVFEKLSMQIDLDDVDEKFDLTLSESHDMAGTDKTAGHHSGENNQVEVTQPAKPESEERQETEGSEPVLRGASLKKDIAYWEKRSSSSLESRVLARKANDQFQRRTLQRSTIRKNKKTKIETSSSDSNLGSNSFVENLVAAEMLSGEIDLVERTPREKSAIPVPYVDEKNKTKCTERQSIIPKPAPRKSLLIGGTKVLDRNNFQDKCSHLPKLEPGRYKVAPSMIFSLRGWEERKREKDRVVPTKRLLEWF